MTRRLLLLCLTAAAFTMLPAQQAAAQPTALRDDIQARTCSTTVCWPFSVIQFNRLQVHCLLFEHIGAPRALNREVRIVLV